MKRTIKKYHLKKEIKESIKNLAIESLQLVFVGSIIAGIILLYTIIYL